jgi:hypothetical protein
MPYPAYGSSRRLKQRRPTQAQRRLAICIRRLTRGLRGPTLFEPAGGPVGRIRHLCRHPAQPRVRRLMHRRRAICIRLRTRGYAGWRHKCLIRPTGPPAGSNSVGPSGITAGTESDAYRPAALRLRGPTLFEPAGGPVGRSRRLKQRRPTQAQRRLAICIRRLTRGCAGWRHKCLIRAFMPPSGITAGTESDAYRPAALRLRGPTLFEPAGA